MTDYAESLQAVLEYFDGSEEFTKAKILKAIKRANGDPDEAINLLQDSGQRSLLHLSPSAAISDSESPVTSSLPLPPSFSAPLPSALTTPPVPPPTPLALLLEVVGDKRRSLQELQFKLMTTALHNFR